MNHTDYVDLLRPAILHGGVWADLGSGRGAFTLALAELLGPGATIYSLDRDAAALADQQRTMQSQFPKIALHTLVTDFRQPNPQVPLLDGIVMANSLHFYHDWWAVVQHVCGWLKPGGAFVLVEYDTDASNYWVPHPLSYETWAGIAPTCGLLDTQRIGHKPTRDGRGFYSARSFKPSP